MQPFKSQGLRSLRHVVQPSRPQICSAPCSKSIRSPQHVRPFHHTSRRRYPLAGGSQEATQDMVHVHRPLINRKKIALYVFYGVGTYVMLTLVSSRLAEALHIDLEEERTLIRRRREGSFADEFRQLSRMKVQRTTRGRSLSPSHILSQPIGPFTRILTKIGKNLPSGREAQNA